MQCVTALPGAQACDEAPLETTLATVPYQRLLEPTAQREAQAPAARMVVPPALAEGTEIEGFRILRQIGEGGFGIVYLAWDPALERHVAIKEYMPSSLAVRSSVSLEVSMRSEAHRETFAAGLKSFVNEARLLARFDHPALVKVLRYWTANGTAYMAMPYYEGPTLKTALAQLGSRPSESLLLEWLDPLLDALAVMHGENCYHRDISPDNILLTAAGPLLLDFGAARHVINDRTQVLTTMLKPGFAPIEQYGGTMLQGPWTDLYALASVLHYAITGRPPVASVVRIVKDPLQPLAGTHAGRYGDAFLRAVDGALAVRPESRPQDIAAFRALLAADAAAPAASDEAVAISVETSPREGRKTRRGMVAAAGLVVALAVVAWVNMRVPAASRATVEPSASVSSAPAPSLPAPATATPTQTQTQTATTPPTPMPTPAAIAPAPTPAATAVAIDPPKPMPSAAAEAKVAARKPVAVGRPAKTSASEPAEAISELSEKNRTVDQGGTTVSSYTASGRPPRCSDLVLKSSLEALNSEEAEFQKTRCK